MHFMHSLELRAPWFLLVALLALPVFWLARRAAGRLTFSSLMLLPQRHGSLRLRLAWLPELLLALAVVALGVALAGPRVGDANARVQRKGIAVMMAIDISGSMRALDLSTAGKERTRLDAVKDVFREFVLGGGGLAGRPDDAVGLVSFARYADCRAPLTLDHANLVHAADGLAIVSEREEDGTALGDGLGLAVLRLREAEARSKVIVLLTDGVNNSGETAPLQAAQLAASQGIKVHTIGAGTNGFAPVRVEDPFSGRSILQQMRVEIDEATLKAVAERTGGRYFRATDADALREVYKEIDRLERSQVTEQRFLQYHEYFEVVTVLALILACLGWLLRSTWLRRLP